MSLQNVPRPPSIVARFDGMDHRLKNTNAYILKLRVSLHHKICCTVFFGFGINIVNDKVIY